MALTFIPYNAGSYQCLSTDISGSKVTGASYKGADLFVLDIGLWYRVQEDLTLVPMSVSTVTIAPSTNVMGGTYDAGPSWTSSFGVASACVESSDMRTATVLTDLPTSGKKLVITDIIASSDTSMSLLFEEETSGTDIFKIYLPATSVVQLTPRSKIKLATADKRLTGKASVSGNVNVTVSYYSEA
jgi:hypothetical protein